MSRILSKLIRLSKQKNSPIIVYDAESDTSAVVMDLSYYERNFSNLEEDILDEFESDDEMYEDCENTETPSFTREELSHSEEEAFDLEEESTTALALWNAKREEKEREEIAKVLEEELQENPPADPFEEDFIRSPDWHTVSEAMEMEAVPAEESKIKETPKEPSYHPVINSGGSLSWTDWTNLGITTPIPYKNVPDIILQDEVEVSEAGEEEPVFLEEPI